MNALVPATHIEVGMSEMVRMADAIAKGGLFGSKDPNAVLTLCLMAQADGMHPARAMLDYDIIQGRPTKKAEAMLRDLIRSGGSVRWHALDDTIADATFSHPQGGEVRIAWDMERAKQAGLGGKDMWKKFPRQMLRSRTVSEGVRTVAPGATGGLYVPEEVADFEDPPMRDVTPPHRAKAAETVQEGPIPEGFNVAETEAVLIERWAIATGLPELQGAWRANKEKLELLKRADPASYARVEGKKDERKMELSAEGVA